MVTIDSYEDVPPNDESALKKVRGPVSRSARCKSWMFNDLHGVRDRSLCRKSDMWAESGGQLLDVHL